MTTRERKFEIRRVLGRVSMRAKQFKEGEDFVTIVSRRPGVVLEARRDGILVSIEGELQVRRLHPEIWLEHP